MQDIIKKLLTQDPNERLGMANDNTDNDFDSLKSHKFFNNIDFADLINTNPPIKINNAITSKLSSDSIINSIRSTTQYSQTHSEANSSDFYFSSSNNTSKNNSPFLMAKNIGADNISNRKLSNFFIDENYINLDAEENKENDISNHNNNKVYLITEGLIKKKSPWFYYNTRLLKLYSNSTLEYWDPKKKTLRVSICYII